MNPLITNSVLSIVPHFTNGISIELINAFNYARPVIFGKGIIDKMLLNNAAVPSPKHQFCLWVLYIGVCGNARKF